MGGRPTQSEPSAPTAMDRLVIIGASPLTDCLDHVIVLTPPAPSNTRRGRIRLRGHADLETGGLLQGPRVASAAMVHRERSRRAAFAGLALLVSNLGCDDARPKVQVAARTAAAASTASVAATVSTAAKLDAMPTPTAPEKRLRQQQIGTELVIDSEGKWASDCLIHRACKVKARTLDLCPPGSNAPLWPTLPGQAEHFTDPRVAVRGQLVMTDHWFSSAVAAAWALRV